MLYETLIFERSDALAEVTLNRPDKLNALNERLVDELQHVAVAIGRETQIRAVLLTGAGRGFCSGADLNHGDLRQSAGPANGAAIGASLRDHFNPMVQAWADLPIPVIVAVNGIAAGAGMSLALLGDIVLAAHSATFLQLFAPRLGLMPDLGSTFFLPRLVGTARAKGMALLGEAVSAADAAEWGLIWACVEDAALLQQAQAIARRLAAGPTQAFKRIKTMFGQEPARTLPEQLALEAIAQAELGATLDFASALVAFHAKQPAAFTGR